MCITHIKALSLEYTFTYLELLHMGFKEWNYDYDYPTNIAYSKLNYIKL
jgi:hypothetical protein